jgi:signal transduction histidine kinase
MVALVAWTAYVVWAYDSPRRRTTSLLAADLGIALAAILLSPLVKGPHLAATLPGFWVMGAVLAWGIRWNALGGLVAAVAVSLADIVVRYEMTTVAYSHVFLLMVGGPTVGYASGLLKEMAAARDRAEREAAEARERARLARVVHDGVLQVLALVQRRGAEIGGEAAQLGELAGNQEAALRAFVQEGPTRDLVAGVSDLSSAVSALQSRQVTVSVPGTPVPLPDLTVSDIVAVVRECLLNVQRHVGVHAPAWVSVEDLGDHVVVSVRDDGPGIRPGRLDEARRQGRLGVAESIRGRVAALGGTARLTSEPGQGVEWEVTVPRDEPTPSEGLGAPHGEV